MSGDFDLKIAQRFEGEYNIEWIHYRNMYGEFLGKEPMFFKRLWGVGNEFIANYKRYVVRRVAIVDNVQHVNIEPIGGERCL